MKKTLVDANVILRYLLRDNEEMFQAAVQAIDDGAFTLPEILEILNSTFLILN